MIAQTIYNYVAKRCDKISTETFFEELNRAWSGIWFQIDAKDALREMELQPTAERQITLPWFVYEPKGVRDYYEVPLALMTPRPYYNQEAPTQSDYTWRILHRTPLVRPLAVHGRLKLRPRRKLAKKVQVNIRGPGEFGTTEMDAIELAVGQASAETTVTFTDVTSISKSEITSADIEFFDVQENRVAMLPADQTDVWCNVIQLTDTHANRVGPTNGRYYTVLFKSHPPKLSDMTDAVPTEYGMILQDVLVASILGGVRDDMAQKVSDKAGTNAAGVLGGIMNKSAEGMVNKISTGRSPYLRRRHVSHL